MRVLFPAEMRAVDERAISQLGVPGVVLMENAGAAVARRVADVVASRDTARVVVLCGPGNNGGDGFVTARLLASSGVRVSVYVLDSQSKISGDADVHLRWLRHCGVEPRFVQSCDSEVSSSIERADVVVDAILGTGAHGEISGLLADTITLVNGSSATVVSVDMPSGIEGATGRVLGTAVRADITVTFAYPKIGQLIFPGREYCGRLEIVDIGIPQSALTGADGARSTMFMVDREIVRSLLPRRIQPSHKGTYGQLVVVAGSVGMPGAASLACTGALRSGVGTVVAVAPRSIQPILHVHSVEVMTEAADESGEGTLSCSAIDVITKRLSRASAFVIGPGLGRDGAVTALVERVLEAAECPGVVDADGLVALGRSDIDLCALGRDLVLTPHPGEMSALTGLPVSDILADPVSVCSRWARDWNKTVVLKGATTVIGAPDGSLYISTRGNAGLATGGTGDVLAGLIGGFVAQGVAPTEAAISGVYIHGVAGELASNSVGMAGVLARDVAAMIPRAVEDTLYP